MRIILFALSLFLVAGCCKSDNRLIVFGDSISADDHNSSEPERYVHALAVQLNRTLINNAKSGTVFSDLNQYPMIMSTKFSRSDSVIIMVGFNDASQFGTDREKVAEFEKKFSDMLDYISTQPATFYIATQINRLPETYDMYKIPRGGPEAIVSAQMRALSSRTWNNIYVVDLFSLFPVNEQTINVPKDHIHPSVYGFGLIENIFWGVMNGASRRENSPA